eukprot:1268695-Pleurochrysis_carterae.AAC.1
MGERVQVNARAPMTKASLNGRDSSRDTNGGNGGQEKPKGPGRESREQKSHVHSQRVESIGALSFH